MAKRKASSNDVQHSATVQQPLLDTTDSPVSAKRARLDSSVIWIPQPSAVDSGTKRKASNEGSQHSAPASAKRTKLDSSIIWIATTTIPTPPATPVIPPVESESSVIWIAPQSATLTIPTSTANPTLAPVESGINLPTTHQLMIEELPDDRYDERYQNQKTIGSGSFGTVVRATDSKDETKVVVKTFIRDKVIYLTDTSTGPIPTEIYLLMKLEHPNIVPLLAAYSSIDNFRIVMPDTDGKDVSAFIKKENNPPIRWLALQMGKGLEYLHDSNIVHQDFKLENVIISQNPLRVQIIDFGLSKMYIKGKQDFIVTGGTPGYICKEFYTREKIEGPEADVFSFGAAIFFMNFNRKPFPGEEDIKSLHQAKLPDYIFTDPKHFPLRDILMATLTKYSDLRWTIPKILTSSWIKQPDD